MCVCTALPHSAAHQMVQGYQHPVIATGLGMTARQMHDHYSDRTRNTLSVFSSLRYNLRTTLATSGVCSSDGVVI